MLLQLEDLPLEILSLIIEFSGCATTLSTVSRRLRAATRISQLHLDFTRSSSKSKKLAAGNNNFNNNINNSSALEIAVVGLQAWRLAAHQVTWPFPSFPEDPRSCLSLTRSLKLTSPFVVEAPFLADLTHLTHLDLSGTRVSSIEALVSCTSLIELELSGCPVTDLHPLSGKLQLKRLLISSTPVTDLSPLSTLPALNHLCACQTHVTDLNPLSPCTCLETLCLNNILELDSLQGVLSCPLKRLRIKGTRVSTLEVPPAWNELIELDLADCQVSVKVGIPVAPIPDHHHHQPHLPLPVQDDEENSDHEHHNNNHNNHHHHHHQTSQLESLAISFTKCTRLVTLDLTRQNLGDGTALSVCDALESLVVDCSHLTSLSFLANLPLLNHLSASNITTLEDFTPLRSCQQLKIADLSETPLRTLDVLTSPVLHSLKVSHTLITDLSGLARCPNLRYLDLDHTSANCLQPLHQLAHLETLHACFTKVSDLEGFCSPHVKYLFLAHTPVESISPLIGCESLLTLNVTGSKVVNLDAIQSLKQLAKFFAVQTGVTSLEPLKDHPGLTHLGISFSQVSNLETLATIPSLKEIGISGCPVTDFSPLLQCPNLAGVSLDGIHHSNPDIQRLSQSCVMHFTGGDE